MSGCAPARRPVEDPLAGAELFAVSAGLDAARVRRSGIVSEMPFGTGVTADAVFPFADSAALQFDGKSAMALPGLDLTGGEAVSMSAWVHLPKIALHPGQTGLSHALVIASQMSAGDAEAKPAIPSTGWVFEIDEGVARLRLLDAAGKSIRAQAPYHKPIKAGEWSHLTFTYDGSRKEDGYAFYMNGVRMAIERGSYGAQDSAIAPELKESIRNTAPLTIGASASGEKGSRDRWPGFASSTGSSLKKKPRLAAAWPSNHALKLYLPDVSRPRIPEAARRVRTREPRASRDRIAFEHGDGPRGTARLEGDGTLLFRGMYDQPRELLEAATPSFLPPMAPELPRNRLGLARWIVD